MPSIESLPASPVFYPETTLTASYGNGSLTAQRVSYASRRVLTEYLFDAGPPLKMPSGAEEKIVPWDA
jgi:hypothetical protein